MAQPTIQTSFASGEWAPKLRSRVDIQKYRTGAALMRNFFVDWSGGGASTRQGTRFLQQVGAPGARLIPFQPSANVSYVLEFGAGYIRFYSNGAPILVSGNPYQIPSPYAITDLFFNPLTGNPGLKYTQDVTSMILTHPNYPVQVLTIISPTNWVLNTPGFGTTIGAPTGVTSSTTLVAAANNWNYGYEVTAVDVNGQESVPSAPTLLTGFKSLSDTTAPGTNLISWTAVTGAQSYNVYKATSTFNTAIPAGSPTGFIGNVTGTSFVDPTPGILPDFSQTPPIAQNPFQGSGVQSYFVTAPGTYTTVPGVTVGAPPPGGAQATAQAVLAAVSGTLVTPGLSFTIGQIYNVGLVFGGAVYATIQVLTTGGGGGISTFAVVWAGSIMSGSTPSNPLTIFNPLGAINNATINVTWGVAVVNPIQDGAGYLTPPSVTFSAGAATATANLGTFSSGNPGVSTFFQERLVFGAQQANVQDFNMSQPGSFQNFNTTFPVEDDNAISGQIIADDLNAIRSFTNVPTGLITFTNKSAWLLGGGSGGFASNNPVTPTSIVASQQAFNGANDLRPIKINLDILYGTYKGNYVRDLSYNVYANVFTGSDITTLSNHLFLGLYLLDWCWAEEPFKTVWAVRNDGILLSLTYVKEQELVGWAHHDTNGQFLSVCSVTENVNGDSLDAVYVIVQRFIGGFFVQYVERFADRFFFYGKEDAWSVDCALSTAPNLTPTTAIFFLGDARAIGNTVVLVDNAGAPFTAAMATNHWVVRVGGGAYQINTFVSSSNVQATVTNIPENINPYTGVPNPVLGYSIWQPITSVSGAALSQLNGQQVVGIADGVAIGPFTVSSGPINLGMTATKVVLGLPFTPQLQTLPLDLGEPTVQSKRKKIPALTMRVADTLGLQVGTTFSNLVTFKDFQLGAIPTQSNGVSLVTDLVSGDGRQILDQVWQEIGQLCIQQNLPYPATILGVMPEVVVGDTPETGGRRG
jgi:hypothetical protein